ncbi:hypothetical protein CQ011_15905 [Arthrobacter sp. MYb213]|nr:hypothetical protein CQ011_15905 [Arthrobacter sp. MYb213]
MLDPKLTVTESLNRLDTQKSSATTSSFTAPVNRWPVNVWISWGGVHDGSLIGWDEDINVPPKESVENFRLELRIPKISMC